MKSLYCAPAILLVLCGSAPGQTATASADKSAQAGSAHPDLSGMWMFTIILPSTPLKRVVNGELTVSKNPSALAVPLNSPPAGALPSTAAPSYKPEFQAKVKSLFENENKTDPAFYCGKPGVPRIGPPRKIVQLPNEMVFLYEDVSGDPYRVIPTDGRPHRARGNPSAYGDSVGRWEGDTFVVDVTNFTDDTWFGEGGYFHTDKMHVTERFWRVGENLAWQATVEDPSVLAEPWTMPAKVVKPSTNPLEESPRCVEDDGARLLNNDHHAQR
jgi:hypothetical protein